MVLSRPIKNSGASSIVKFPMQKTPNERFSVVISRCLLNSLSRIMAPSVEKVYLRFVDMLNAHVSDVTI